MPTLAELGLAVGDTVKFSALPHSPNDRSLTLEEYTQWRHSSKEITVEGTIVAFDEGGVYIHPFVEALSAFRRVQNTKTGEIYAARVQLIGDQILPTPLAEYERFVIALNRNSNSFLPVEASELQANFLNLIS